ncbi:MAG: FHA domain-containing protein [Planctomycetes bacterium]|nr:FHA domain-containing protein [Planctomycetota bacterium]
MFAQLVPADGGDPITIEKDVTIVGRQAEHCDLVLTRKSISKIHCIIAKTDGLLFVRDLDSTNGTKVNGQKIVRGALLPGDVLSFAGEKFKVHLGPSPRAEAMPPIDRTQMLDQPLELAQSDDFSGGESPTSRQKNQKPRIVEDLVE